MNIYCLFNTWTSAEGQGGRASWIFIHDIAKMCFSTNTRFVKTPQLSSVILFLVLCWLTEAGLRYGRYEAGITEAKWGPEYMKMA